MPWDKPWGQSPDVQTATTTPSELGDTLTNMLPLPERPPPQDRPFETMLNAIPDPPWATTAKYGFPILGSIYGGALGPAGKGIGGLLGKSLTTGLGAAAGEAGGELAAGEPLNPSAIGWTGALSAAAVPVTRALEGGYRAVRATLSSGGDKAIAAAVGSGEKVPTSNLRQALNDVRTGATDVLGTAETEPTTGFEKLRKFIEKYQQTMPVEVPFDRAASMRDDLGQLMLELRQGSPAFHKAQALYGALMSDFRQAAAGSAPSAAGYLQAMTDKNIAHALEPNSWLERMMLYGLGGYGIASGNYGALGPAAGLLGLRAIQATPPSAWETVIPAGATLINPFRGTDHARR